MPLRINHKLWVQQQIGGDNWMDCQPGHDDPDDAREHVRECRKGMPYQYRVVERTIIIHEDVVDPPPAYKSGQIDATQPVQTSEA